jgi:hypothetical protein
VATTYDIDAHASRSEAERGGGELDAFRAGWTFIAITAVCAAPAAAWIARRRGARATGAELTG